MKKLYTLIAVTALFLVSCTKRDLLPADIDVHEWMRTHDRGVVALVDHYTGNYIVDTYHGFAVVESWSGIPPRTYDLEYAFFSMRGVQSIYNYSGNYFMQGRVADYWLTWPQALDLLDALSYYGGY